MMPSRAKKVDREVAKLRSIPKELVSLFLTGPMTGEVVNAAGATFKKALIEASLSAELSHHLGYAPGEDRPEPATNHRNGSTTKSVLTGDGKLRIETRATATAVSSRCLCPNTPAASPASTTRSSRCMRAA
jgi:putative transposase